MKYLLVFVDEEKKTATIVDVSKNKEMLKRKAEKLHPNDDRKYYIVIKDESMKIVYES